jgi:16S rRNA (cytidine1402-2'-O)-methyltransferase
MFVGFLPKKKGRQTLWREMAALNVPIVIFESPNRVMKTLTELETYLGVRQIIVGRELTKIHEEILKLSSAEALTHFGNHPPKGEFVIVIAPDYN